MKKVLFILYCLPILFIGCSSQDTYIDPIKYNDALVEQQIKVIQKNKPMSINNLYLTSNVN